MKTFFAFYLFSIAATAFANPQNEDPIARNLFPPEMVMKHQQEIALDENQRTAIKGEIQKAQSKFLDLQWQVEAETQKMAQLLQAPSIEEAKVLAQADKIMDLEREVKKTHLSLLIRIKSTLNPKQQAKLMEIRNSSN